jgi:CheY-like chemotaxis protein
VRKLVVEVLRGRGYRPIAFARGDEAAEFAISHRGALCCAVVDVVMPGTSGVETVLRIHKLRPQLPVVLITGYSAGLDTQALVRKPHVYLLMKPFDPATLLSAVDKAAAGAPSAPDTEPSPSSTVTAS